MARAHHPERSERGMALVMAMLVLLVLALLAGVLMVSLNVGTRLTSHGLREASALNLAEAGVAEALAQVRAGDAMPDSSVLNPRQVTQIFLTAAGSVPALGPDSIALPTAQPAGQWLRYTTPAKGPDVLTVEYKTDPARTTIFRYDLAKSPPVNTLTGYPIYRVTSTGVVGGDRRQVVTEVIKRPAMALANAAMVADVGIKFSGSSVICGYNHRLDTPLWTSLNGRIVGDPASCAWDLANKKWEVGSGDKPGAWSSTTIDTTGANKLYPSAQPFLENQTGFYAGPWEVLTIQQADFYSWIGAPTNTEPNPPRGIIHIDNNSIYQDRSGAFAYHGGDGEGLLYVDGKLTLNGNFTFKGLVYVEGDLDINGNVWVLGSIIVKGLTQIKLANGTCTVLYSKDAIEQTISKYGGRFTTLSWREGN